MFTHTIRPTLAVIVFTVMASTANAGYAVSELHNATVNQHRRTVANTLGGTHVRAHYDRSRHYDHRPHHRRYAHSQYYRSYRGHSRDALRSRHHDHFYSSYGRRHRYHRVPRYRSYYY